MTSTRRPQGPDDTRRPPHVLIVEDEPGTAGLIRAVVLRHGHGASASVVADGLHAIRYLRGAPPYEDREAHPNPDLVILDLGLPGISGFQILTYLDTNPSIPDCPVVVFSGTSDPEDARRAYSLGARAFLPKSADPLRLVEAVRQSLERWAPQRQAGGDG